MNVTADLGVEMAARAGEKSVRPLAATVAERTNLAITAAHENGALTREVECQVITRPGELALVTCELPGRPEQPLALDVQKHGIGIHPRRIAGCRLGRGGRPAELAGEDRSQICERARLRSGAVDLLFIRERDALPEHLEDADQPQRHRIGIQVYIPALNDQPLDELAHQGGEVIILLAADLVVLLTRAGLAPERVPHRDLPGAGEIRVEIQLDELLERANRRLLQPRHRLHDPLLEFRGQVSQ